MRNRFLPDRQRAEVDSQVAKILRGLGHPPPPLDLSQVRELLRLDLRYYSSTDDGALREFASRLLVAGKLPLERPARLGEFVKKFDLKALFVPDGQRILLDTSQPEAKWCWSEAHEVIHSVLPHHQSLMHGDDLYNLNPSCHIEIEHEANYGAGRLLFLQDQFTEFTSGAGRPSFLAWCRPRTGNSRTRSPPPCGGLWRLDVPAVGMVGTHPRHAAPAGTEACRYFLRSRPFEAQFSHVSEDDVLRMVRSYATWSRRGPLGSRDLIICDDNGNDQVFTFETFYNGYEALTLAVFAHSRARLYLWPQCPAHLRNH